MGRKRWWREGLELFLLCVFLNNICCDGDVGCLFSEGLCRSDIEICYNDLAFGRCVQSHGKLDEEDLHTYDLHPNQLELLRERLEQLAIEGYRWPHPFTQCIIQRALLSLRFGTTQSGEFCEHLKQDRSGIVDDIDFDGNSDVHSQEIAIVKFTPSEEDPHGDYADELYYPPEVQKEVVRFLSQDPYAVERIERTKSSYERPKSSRGFEPYRSIDNISDDMTFDAPRRILYKKSPASDLSKEKFWVNAKNNYDHSFGHSADVDSREDYHEKYNNYKSFPNNKLEFLAEIVGDADGFRNLEERNNEQDDNYASFSSGNNGEPGLFSKLEFLTQPKIWFDPSSVFDSDTPVISQMQTANDYNPTQRDFEEFYDPHAYRKQTNNVVFKDNGIYTEGGLVKPSKQNIVRSEDATDMFDDNEDFTDDLDPLLLRRQLVGFKRRERLDVKKPGPPFATNNYAFKTQSSKNAAPSVNTAEENREKKTYDLPLVKKELSASPKSTNSANTYKNVDMDHVYLQIKGEFRTWPEGETIVNEINKLLGLEANSLTDIRVGRAEVTFKIKPQNAKGLNATDILGKIDDIRNELENNTGVEVVRAGIGDKIKLPAAHSWEPRPELESSSFNMFLAAGLAAAGAAAVVTLLIAKRHAKSRSKLAGLSAPDLEASKDYQDLCRVRMQSKQPTEKPDSPRIVSLSRESESNNSPSSRSSTSSWSEEPALSNMDISTGHMVLSYMEDHLKNKDRLDQEWTALCAYEAEPSSTTIAEDEANVKRNRAGASLPYDHSRVVLNDLANINNSDYINASTITDHDPRNPAYIATQGALPQTAADFWQLVWEQGSVVIVMLSRLTEEGQAMCHRYWPEEGSELYHIYEVHLVSEHIWCDDYLVRSFYLKNLRTGETRTVTQFHFLSWPENGVPHSTKALLEFRRKVNKSYRGRSCPIVVHCSDGAGRTGTYCLIDMVLNRMAKGAKEIDIAATLEHIRDQRPGMVATKQQFEFVLMAVAEEVHAILKALPIPPVEKSSAQTSTTILQPMKPNQ